MNPVGSDDQIGRDLVSTVRCAVGDHSLVVGLLDAGDFGCGADTFRGNVREQCAVQIGAMVGQQCGATSRAESHEIAAVGRVQCRPGLRRDRYRAKVVTDAQRIGRAHGIGCERPTGPDLAKAGAAFEHRDRPSGPPQPNRGGEPADTATCHDRGPLATRELAV